MMTTILIGAWLWSSGLVFLFVDELGGDMYVEAREGMVWAQTKGSAEDVRAYAREAALWWLLCVVLVVLGPIVVAVAVVGAVSMLIYLLLRWVGNFFSGVMDVVRGMFARDSV